MFTSILTRYKPPLFSSTIKKSFENKLGKSADLNERWKNVFYCQQQLERHPAAAGLRGSSWAIDLPFGSRGKANVSIVYESEISSVCRMCKMSFKLG